ncbi:MAG TPA: 5-methyltetrahydropteroyltriglutamate--homocysteine S-methyltransferase [Nevskiaceae bacterium]
MPSIEVSVASLGFPRIGPRRELKFALESYWAGKSSQAELLEAARKLRSDRWQEQRRRGVTVIPCNDFSLYDHMLDTALMVGAVPARFGAPPRGFSMDTYFAMARGSGTGTAGIDVHGHAQHDGKGAAALEMTKWFDTNYHYLVPELSPDQRFELCWTKPLDEFREAKALGIHTRPVLVGPVTFLKLAKAAGNAEDGSVFDPLSLLPRLLPVYGQLLRQLAAAGVDWVQIDEPVLVLDLSADERAALATAYQTLSAEDPRLKLMLTTYFGRLGDNLDSVLKLPIDGLHVDLLRAPEQLDAVLDQTPADWLLSLGVVDGRNVWRADLSLILDRLDKALAAKPRARLELAPSCSLLHVPVDLDAETELDAELRQWLAFAVQKLDELKTLAAALREGRAGVSAALQATDGAVADRRRSTRVHDAKVAKRLQELGDAHRSRKHPFAQRHEAQLHKLSLPKFPTTTIGSFPQTGEIRKARAALAHGELSRADYEAKMRSEIEQAIRWQEQIGLDVLVHGEFERNDMVQYFGEQLTGFAFTRLGWVQSYGSRCVRPPIIYGDVSRPHEMTVTWWRYAQSLTSKPVKAMLTGPVTMLNWSFVRDDEPREQVCRQIALAIRDEVMDLEAAGAAIIQIDEAAFREGLPLRHADWAGYLEWAVDCFRLCSSGVADATQIHSHMCYSEFNDIIKSIAAMDADVISIETSRSRMELLDAFRGISYPNQIGPGVYDIHSPRVPGVGEISNLLTAARQRLTDGQLWVNPDCGLKTRRWEEVRPALTNMVEAAQELRRSL